MRYETWLIATTRVRASIASAKRAIGACQPVGATVRTSTPCRAWARNGFMSEGNSQRSITTLSPGRQSIASATRLTPCATLDGKPMSPGSAWMSAATFEATRARTASFSR